MTLASSQPSASLTPPLKIAVGGTGFGQKVHIPALQAHPATQVVAVYHRELAKAQAIAAQHQIPHACDTIEEIVALPQVQGVTLATPPFVHFEMAQTILKAGKPLLLEKPTTLNAAEARELYHLAVSQKVAAALNFEFRFVPSWRRLQELLAEGYVGRKRLIKIDWLVSGRADSSRPWSWQSSKEAGGGALGALGSHTFDYIAWLFGPIQRLCAQLKTMIPYRPDPVSGMRRLVDADDTCALMLELADGTPCQVNISFVTDQGRGHWVEVYGDRGTLVLGSDNQQDYVHGFRLWASPTGQPLQEVEIPKRLALPQVFADGRIAPVMGVIDHWVEKMSMPQTLVPGLREGVYSQLLMDLAHQSNTEQRWVEVPEIDTYLHQR